MPVNKNAELLYEAETKLIRDACYEVWNQFGGAFKEKIIDCSLNIALENRGLKVDSQKRIDIYFQSQKVGTYVPDKIIDDKILIELKCKPYLTKEDERQFWLYLKRV
ncbi:MAG: GxxExxY protein [Patescibacteria group bacterium]